MPFAIAAVFHKNDAVVPATVWLIAATADGPLNERLNVREPLTPPADAVATVAVPLTVALSAGLVNDAVSGVIVGFETVTVRVAVAVAPAASVTVVESEYEPFATFVVSHA